MNYTPNNTHAAKLNRDSVQHIRSFAYCGFSKTSIANVFGLSLSAVWDIVGGRSWKHLPYVHMQPPIINPDLCDKLSLRGVANLSQQQRDALLKYFHRQSSFYVATANRDGGPVREPRWWTTNVIRILTTRTGAMQC